MPLHLKLDLMIKIIYVQVNCITHPNGLFAFLNLDSGVNGFLLRNLELCVR